MPRLICLLILIHSRNNQHMHMQNRSLRVCRIKQFKVLSSPYFIIQLKNVSLAYYCKMQILN